MRKISSLFILLLFSIAACSSTDNKSQLHGKISQYKETWVYLEQLQGANIVKIDSVKTNDLGEFSFKKAVPEKDFYRLRVGESNVVFVILDPKESVQYINEKPSLQEKYTLEGSDEGKLILEIKAVKESIDLHRDSLMQILNAAPQEQRMAIQASMEQGFNVFVNNQIEKIRNFITQNPDKLAPITAAEFLDPDKDFKAYDALATNLKKNYPKSSFAQSFIGRVDQMRSTAIGMPMPDINLTSPTGNPIALSSLKGKVVLIDFWASWCGPCRKENPNVVKLYEEMKSKGFDIYSISLDKDKAAWEKAIQADGLTWPSHVSDLGGWNSSVVKQFGITGIPFTILIDKDGNIFGKGLRGADLDNAVHKLLN
jgi:thiol-disulfide isomerase/thioredoxin